MATDKRYYVLRRVFSQVAVGDQPEDIEDQIHKLIREYIDNPLSIILAVVTANADMATSESLKLAREADPQGNRTLAVVTKIDLMDSGTDAYDILNGKVIAVKLGIVGVKNRSQKDIMEKTVEDALHAEAEFFRKYYHDIANKNGTTFLAQSLSNLLKNHIRRCLPAVESKIKKEVSDCEALLESYGCPIENKEDFLLKIICMVSVKFCSLLTARPVDVSVQYLYGGAKIAYILHTHMDQCFASIRPCEAYSLEEVIMAVRNSNVPEPPKIVSQPAFEALLAPQIRRLLPFALECLNAVHEELLHIAQECLPSEIDNLPKLRKEIEQIIKEMARVNVQKATEMIKNLAAIELSHVTYNRLSTLEEEITKLHLDVEPDEDAVLPFKSETTEIYLRRAQSQARPDRDGIASTEQLLKVTTKDKKHIRALGVMLQHYFEYISENLKDSITKTTMCFVVNDVKDTIQVRLSTYLNNANIDDLFQERTDMVAKREESESKLKALQESLGILNDLSTEL